MARTDSLLRWLGPRRPHPRGILAMSLAGILSLSVTRVRGDEIDDRATARSLFFEAVKAAQNGAHQRAADLFHRSDQLFAAPTAKLGRARALAAQGQLVRASETYHALLRSPAAADESEAFARARVAAQIEVAKLEPMIGRLTLHVSPEVGGLVVEVDGVRVPEAARGVPRPTDPGAHTVAVSAPGYIPLSRDLELAVGGRQELRLRLEPRATEQPAPSPNAPLVPRPAPSAELRPVVVAPPPSASGPSGSSLRGAGYIALGVGAAGFIGAAVTGLMHRSSTGVIEEECTPQGDVFTCSDRGLEAVERGQTLEPINTALFAVGGVGAAGGAGLLIAGFLVPDNETLPSNGDSIAVAPWVAPGLAGATVRIRY